MFHYLHGYMPAYWPGLVRRGFIDDTSGVKLTQNLLNEPEDKFNGIAAEGGELFRLVTGENRPFYIDRLQGGCYYEDYPFDKGLINRYAELLGDNFYGFQMHEWLSNYKHDWHKIIDVVKCRDFTEAGIEKAIKKGYDYPHTFLESQSAAEFAAQACPKNAAELAARGRELFRKRQEAVLGYLIPADSAFMAPKIELELGAKRLMPEVGAQIPHMRIQVAYTRGMARSAGVPWGLYYEPWGGDPFGVCYYKTDNINEWNIREDEDFPFKRTGGTGGSSRALQKRVHHYGYVSGAEFISEEWGVCNTFYDWIDYEVTDYGKVKLDFLNFVKRYPDIGEAFTPVAIALPADMDVLEITGLNNGGRYLGYKAKGSFRKELKAVRDGLLAVFGSMDEAIGNEAQVIRNGGLPDAFDIVHADDEKALRRFDYILDLSGDGGFAKRQKNIVSLRDLEPVLRNILPCWVEGGAHWLVNQRANGGFFLAVFNNNGVERSVEKGERLLPEAGLKVKITLKEGRHLRLLEGEAVKSSGEGFEAFLPPSGWIFAEIS